MKLTIFLLFLSCTSSKNSQYAIEPSLLRKILTSNKESFKSCIESDFYVNGHCDVNTHFTINEEGRTQDIMITPIKNECLNKTSNMCLVKKIEELKFPKPKQGTVNVKQPFHFAL